MLRSVIGYAGVRAHGEPGECHDFDVAGEFSGFAKKLEVGAHCDIDISFPRVVRMDHKDDPNITLAGHQGSF
jgi:hypothetical protein